MKARAQARERLSVPLPRQVVHLRLGAALWITSVATPFFFWHKKDDSLQHLLGTLSPNLKLVRDCGACGTIFCYGA